MDEEGGERREDEGGRCLVLLPKEHIYLNLSRGGDEATSLRFEFVLLKSTLRAACDGQTLRA